MPINATGKKASVHGKLPAIKCASCGAEIMLVPNLKAMSKAIEAHVEKHRLKVKDPMEAEAEAESIRDSLITQVFDKAS